LSHAPERKEKDCLNCGTIIHGRFCHVCGQENLEPKESFWHLITHFFNDITHFDGKFFTSLKDLLFKPGFLPKEYMKGRRASYLNPVRMYVFTSAIFFLIFFSFFNSENARPISLANINGQTMDEIDAMDSMTRAEFNKYKDSVVSAIGIQFTGRRYTSRAEYDSLLASGAKKHNWIQRQFIYKEIAINEKYKDDPSQVGRAFKSKLLHSLPQMLFISLPLLALILKLFYIRRKQFYYVSHGIFSMHLYVFLFIAMLFLFSISSLNSYLHWGVLRVIFSILIIWLFIYEYLALKNFYGQGWIKTFFKFLLINLTFLIVLSLLFVVFILFSLFKI
jgi:hypothetical protein